MGPLSLGLVFTPTIHRVTCVLNSVAAGRRLAWRAVVWQAVATVLVAAVFLVQGLPSAWAVLAGGGAIVLGGWAATMVALGGGVDPAGVALARLLLGLALKWLLALVVIWVALALLRLPGLPMLAGVVVSTLAMTLANSIKR